MKTNKLKSIMVAMLAFGTTATMAQNEYSIAAKANTKLVLEEVNEVSIEGYSGSEIVFEATNLDRDDSERASGLRAINSLGLDDNTGIGLSVIESNGELRVLQISRNSDTKYKIKVPTNTAVSYTHSTHFGDDIYLKDLGGELEISTTFNDLKLDDVTGPMTISSVHGDVEVGFSTVSQSNPISIASVHGLVDVSISEGTKANLKLSSGWGEIYTNLDIAFDQAEKKSNSKILGKINGGGIDMSLSSSHGNVYLRKK